MLRQIFFAVAIAVTSFGAAHSQTPDPQPPASTAESREQEFAAAFQEGVQVASAGPSDVPLLGQAQLHLPQGYRFIPQPQAGRLMRALGNRESSSLVGLAVPADGSLEWIVVVSYIGAGYIKDDEAKDWKADDLLANLRAGTEEGNKDRLARGFPALEIVGWVEPPAYDAQTHRLVWAATMKHVDDGPYEPHSVNYKTFALGREGYFTLNLVTEVTGLTANKVHSRKLLSALDYNTGKAYTDFNSSTDNVAAYGITALVAGAAAKKLGLLAILGAFLLKSAKLIVVAFGGLAYAVRKLFRHKGPPPPTA